MWRQALQQITQHIEGMGVDAREGTMGGGGDHGEIHTVPSFRNEDC